jgi:hypothetical protein
MKIHTNHQSQWLTDFTAHVADTYQPYIDLEATPSGPLGYSDQVKYWQYGFNAIITTEYLFNPNIHSPQDTIENMNTTYATKICKLLLATLVELAQSNLQIPLLYIDSISGGFGVHSTIMNVGTAPAQNINWSINISRDKLFLGGISTGVIPSIDPGASAVIKSRFILGFGSHNITITADTRTKTAVATLFFCFVGAPVANP